MFPVAGDSRSGELSASFPGSTDKHISKVCNISEKTFSFFFFNKIREKDVIHFCHLIIIASLLTID